MFDAISPYSGYKRQVVASFVKRIYLTLEYFLLNLAEITVFQFVIHMMSMSTLTYSKDL